MSSPTYLRDEQRVTRHHHSQGRLRPRSQAFTVAGGGARNPLLSREGARSPWKAPHVDGTASRGRKGRRQWGWCWGSPSEQQVCQRAPPGPDPTQHAQTCPHSLADEGAHGDVLQGPHAPAHVLGAVELQPRPAKQGLCSWPRPGPRLLATTGVTFRNASQRDRQSSDSGLMRPLCLRSVTSVPRGQPGPDPWSQQGPERLALPQAQAVGQVWGTLPGSESHGPPGGDVCPHPDGTPCHMRGKERGWAQCSEVANNEEPHAGNSHSACPQLSLPTQKDVQSPLGTQGGF